MPINELETHPYLNGQITDFTDKEKLSKYCKLIVGTFPIYAVTDSEPIEDAGLLLRKIGLTGHLLNIFMEVGTIIFGGCFVELLMRKSPLILLKPLGCSTSIDFLLQMYFHAAAVSSIYHLITI